MESFKQTDAFLALREIISEGTRPVVVWTGAGVSRAAGLPTWKALKEHLVARARSQASEFDSTEATRRAVEADAIGRSGDYWSDFERLRNLLGESTYTQEIRVALSAASDAHTPEILQLIWRLPIEGIMTLNIDRLASRAFAEAGTKGTLVEKTGPDIARLRHVLFSGQKFVANLHGEVESSHSWIFTAGEISNLVKNATYAEFVRLVLSTCVNVFVGLTITDRAVGGQLDRLLAGQVESAPSFWLTHDRSPEAHTWAEARGVRVVRYQPDESHSQLIDMMSDLASHVADEEPPAPPVAPPPVAVGSIAALGDHEALRSRPPHELREILNSRALDILKTGDGDAYSKYHDFTIENDDLIHNAWFVSTREPHNSLFGFKLQENIARGAFGRVYRAIDSSGEPAAVKIMVDEIRHDIGLIESFRRGVRTMRILEERGVPGMVRYVSAAEIPAFVAMEWVDGPNLQEASDARVFSDWVTVLSSCRQIVSILRASHALPERVLHRDLRPPNIMLKDYWGNPDEVKVVLLDFDLSWHRGSLERSIVHTSATGYLAPEQQVARKGVSTRVAAVDVFGFGMTAFFILSGVDPRMNQHSLDTWERTVRAAAEGVDGAFDWVSLPYRFARLVVAATREQQTERWDFARVARELEHLENALLGRRVHATEVVAEELAARVDAIASYKWNHDAYAAEFRSPTGFSIAVSGLPSEDTIGVRITKITTGTEERSNVGKYLARSLEQARKGLAHAFQIRESRVDMGSLLLVGEAQVPDSREGLDRLVRSLTLAADGVARIA